jgi:hypothetical protein
VSRAIFYGDLARGQVFLITKKPEVANMPTAIVILYTTEGFAFAADGLQCKDDGTPINREAQKIFCVTGLGRSLASAFAGTVVIGDENSPERIFDFVSESANVTESLASVNFFGIQKYSEEVARRIADKLAESVADAKAKGLKIEYPNDPAFTYEGEKGSTIARIFTAGYYRGNPKWMQTRFFHTKQQLEQPTVETRVISPGNSMGYGSKIIANLLYNTEDPRFAIYRTVRVNRVEEITMEQAIELASQYIMAQSSPLAKELDPAVCRLIGEKLHVAKLTKREGLKWVVAPSINPG